jgi:prepilin signal peptidase PulO-like enzyme (type II secretory pathway)
VVASVLIAMAVYDFKHKIIPDGMVYTFIALSAVLMILTHPVSELFGIPVSLDLLAGPIFFSFFAFLWLVSDGKWMGFGDAKFAIGVGFLLGFSGGAYATVLAFWIGAAVSIVLLLLQYVKIAKFKFTFKSEIPFAPFIILAVFIQIMTSWNLHSIMYSLS